VLKNNQTMNQLNNQTKRYLGIDWGLSRIGLALGDDETKISTPFKVVSNIKDILKTIKEEEIDIIVLGSPLKMSGADDLNNNFLKFKNNLEKKIDIPIEFIDERLTSKAADALSGDKKSKASRDALAAMIILQSYFDKKNARDL